jgi:hypothetical protein
MDCLVAKRKRCYGITQGLILGNVTLILYNLTCISLLTIILWIPSLRTCEVTRLEDKSNLGILPLPPPEIFKNSNTILCTLHAVLLQSVSIVLLTGSTYML